MFRRQYAILAIVALQVVLGWTAAAPQDAQVPTLRVVDTVEFQSEPQTLTAAQRQVVALKGSRPRTVKTVVTTSASPTATPGQWAFTYESMTLDGEPVADVAGRAYAVTLVPDALVVEPAAGADQQGIARVEMDVQSLRSLFAGEPLCAEGTHEPCPALLAYLRRFGTLSAVANNVKPAALTVAGSIDGVEGEVTGTATVERDKWRIELTVVRRDSIPFETEGQKQQAEARLRATYVMTRAVQRASP